MANVKKQQSIITLDSGVQAPCQEPIVVSASRSTDIPAFYADWFFHRLSVGYSAWTNPFNGAKSYVSYHKTRFIVFWSKNPRPLLPYLDVLKQRGIGCYVQYTLNDYEAEGLERGVPPLAMRIETFRLLVEKLGKGAVVWRFDPLVLTEQMDVQALLQKIARIGDELRGYTEKLVFSFADITSYRKVKANLERNHVHYIDWTDSMMIEFAQRLVQMNREKGWNYVLATCGERINLDGIAHNHCVDDSLMIRLAHHDKELMKFLHAQIYPMPTQDLFGEATPLPPDAIVLDDGTYAMRGDNQDRGQRIYCGCMKSKDVGEYDTCPHQCEYCYANTSKEAALYNYRQHMANPYMDTITGK
jgi:hypothetical protein